MFKLLFNALSGVTSTEKHRLHFFKRVTGSEAVDQLSSHSLEDFLCVTKLHLLVCTFLFFWLCPITVQIYNPGKNIGHKVKKSSKIGPDFKHFSSNFACFWQLLSKFNFWKEDWALGCMFTQIWHFSNISLFPKILSLKPFDNSWGNSCRKFVMLDIKYRFTCGYSDLC